MKKGWILLLCAMLAFTLASCQSTLPDQLPANDPTPLAVPTLDPAGEINGTLGWRLG